MANSENMFRFVSLRPGKLEKGKEKGKLGLYVYNEDSKSAYYSEIKKAVMAGATKEDLAQISAVFKNTNQYLQNMQGIKFPVVEMMHWLADHGRKTFKKAEFISSMEKMAGKPLKEWPKDHDFILAYNGLTDSVLADILSGTPVNEKEEKITAIKILFILKSTTEKTFKFIDEERMDDFFGRSTVIFPLLKASAKPRTPVDPVDPLDPTAPVEPGTKPDPKEEERKKREEKLKQLEKAHRELSNMAIDEKYRYLPEEKTHENDRIKELENQVNVLSSKCREKEENQPALPAAGMTPVVPAAKQEFLLAKKAFKSLNENTRKILSGFHFEPEKTNPVNAVNRIEEEIRYIHSNAEADFSYNSMVAVGGSYVNKKEFKKTMSSYSSSSKPSQSYFKKCTFKAGIGDLLIVRQKLNAYELAEFAHVENALSGEFRERTHRRLDVTEVITETTTETETEKERDLQSTERSEMQTEAEKIIQAQAHVEAGLQVSGSYGPSVSFSSSLSAGFSSSVQETQSKSTSYSREVTEKASEKVRTKITELQKRRVLAEIEETNTHRVDNTAAGAKHVRGIYRWLNKIYDAQIFNYGQRMMYEFVVPEPAAFFLYATVENPPVDTELIKPDLPTYPINGSAPLKPSNLTRSNYNDYVSKYNVTNAPEPPSQFTVKTYFDKQDGKDKLYLGRTAAVSIPDGYEGYAAMISYNSIFEQGSSNFARIMVGGLSIDRNYWGAEFRTFSRKYRGEITVAASLMNKMSFALSVDVFCSLTDEAFANWQLKMYDSIMQAYLDQKAAYDAKIEQKKIQQGVEILGRNPIENLRIVKEELKKLIVMIMTNTPYLDIDSFTNSDEPIMDLSKVCPNGSYIRFFENAFEWENILYVLYPYFWGRHANWVNALHLTDPDLDFAAFLKAGAARVQVPVRPGFEKAVAFYCQTGMIWDGNDVPLIGDELYVPIVKEITENLGKLDEGVAYPEGSQPWEVTIPTSLVVLQDLTEVPNIRDMMTGQNINLNP